MVDVLERLAVNPVTSAIVIGRVTLLVPLLSIVAFIAISWSFRPVMLPIPVGSEALPEPLGVDQLRVPFRYNPASLGYEIIVPFVPFWPAGPTIPVKLLVSVANIGSLDEQAVRDSRRRDKMTRFNPSP